MSDVRMSFSSFLFLTQYILVMGTQLQYASVEVQCRKKKGQAIDSNKEKKEKVDEREQGGFVRRLKATERNPWTLQVI